VSPHISALRGRRTDKSCQLSGTLLSVWVPRSVKSESSQSFEAELSKARPAERRLRVARPAFPGDVNP
jgi:hypothetical protein